MQGNSTPPVDTACAGRSECPPRCSFLRVSACRWLVVLVAILFALAACTPEAGERTELELTLAGEPFTLELAVTPDQRFQGLSGREHIPEDGGMLFVFPEARVLQFVMRDCPVPIDAVFLDAGGRITAIHAMRVEPPETPEHRLKRYSSVYAAQFVIELQGGRAAELGLKRGEHVELPRERLKALAS